MLVAEDDADLGGSIVEALQGALPGVAVVLAGDGVRAWEILTSRRVDVLLADVVMPGLGGREVTTRLRLDPALADTYVILMAGVQPRDELLAAVDEAADDCLLKPLRWEELVVRVRSGLRRAGALRRMAGRVERSEQLYAQQTEFLSVVSHEIRTPLSAIMSAANILLRYGNRRPDSVERFAGVIHEEGQRLTRLINNLLDLAKIEAGEAEWRFEDTDAAELVHRIADSYRPVLRENDLRLEVGAPTGAASVRLDRDRITQVVLNLLSNAVKHSPKGGTIRLRCAAAGPGGVRIEVEDEGPGIPAGLEEQIFERFHRIEDAGDRNGTGLGLTISREIVEHHGGSLSAGRGPGGGALFAVELPAHGGRAD